jgi:TetR/AcrR family transcriptional regulator
VNNQARPRGRPRAEDSPASDDEILLLALRSFADRGYEGTSVRELNLALGVSHNFINSRFGSKEQLWRAAVDRAFEEILETVALETTLTRPGDPLENLRELIVTFIEIAARRPEVSRLMTREASVAGPRLNYLFETYISPNLDPIAELLTKLQADGKMKSVSTTTFFFLLTQGGTAPTTLTPLAALLGITDSSDPAVVSAHARTVAELLIQPASKPRASRSARS